MTSYIHIGINSCLRSELSGAIARRHAKYQLSVPGHGLCTSLLSLRLYSIHTDYPLIISLFVLVRIDSTILAPNIRPR